MRIREHIADYKAAHAAKLPPPPTKHGPTQQDLLVKSWMWAHTRDVHGGTMGDNNVVFDYSFKVAGTFRRWLQRQVDEGIRMRIRESDGCVLFNSKY